MNKAERLICYLFQFPAPIVFVTGRFGHGKTDFSLLIAETLLKYDKIKRVGTNITTNHPDFDLITNLLKLKRWLRSTKGDKLFILDEAGIHIDTRHALSKLNREIRHTAFLLRKFDGKFVLVSQRSKDLDSTFRDTSIWLATFHKLNKKTVRVYGNPLPRPITIFDVPRTSIRFNTKDIAPFSYGALDLELSSMEDQILKEWLETMNYNKVAKKYKLFPQQVKRIIKNRIEEILALKQV